MPSIRISATEVLDTKRILSFVATEQESAEGVEKETVLTITKTNGQDVTLRGDLTKNAAVLEIPPVDSPQTAVMVAIAAKAREK